MIEVEHELHHRRRGRNIGVGLLLGAFIAVVFGLTVAKVLALGDANKFRSFDHVAEPGIVPEAVSE